MEGEGRESCRKIESLHTDHEVGGVAQPLLPYAHDSCIVTVKQDALACPLCLPGGACYKYCKHLPPSSGAVPETIWPWLAKPVACPVAPVPTSEASMVSSKSGARDHSVSSRRLEPGHVGSRSIHHWMSALASLLRVTW